MKAPAIVPVSQISPNVACRPLSWKAGRAGKTLITSRDIHGQLNSYLA
jgi:hypothetical protein